MQLPSAKRRWPLLSHLPEKTRWGRRGAQPPSLGSLKQLQSLLDWDVGSDAPQGTFCLFLVLSGVEPGL